MRTNRFFLTLPLLFVAAVGGAIALHNLPLGQVPWAVSRSAGVGAFAVLSLSVVFGLLIRTKVADSIAPRPLIFELHQFFSVVALSLTGIHLAALLFDSYFAFTPASLLVPGLSPYSTFWVALGTLSAWMAALVLASFWVRKQIGVQRWRTLHYLSFVSYVFALAHGVGAGSDIALPLVAWTYILSAATVGALLAYRILAQAPNTARHASRSSQTQPPQFDRGHGAG